MNLIRRYYGKNICFYYYGEDHLVVNLFKYIKQNIENNILIYINAPETIFSLLNTNLNKNEQNMVRRINLKKQYIDSKSLLDQDDKSLMLNKLTNLKKDAIVEGFWGISIIIDASEVINNSSLLLYEEYLKSISLGCNNVKCNILVCYDFIDYINRGKLITEDIMKLSYKYHTHRMFGNEIVPVENFILNKIIDEKEETLY